MEKHYPQELDENELAFIEEVLHSHHDYSIIDANDGEVSIVKNIRHKKRFYHNFSNPLKSPITWVMLLIVLPIVLAGGFYFISARVNQLFNGDINGLVNMKKSGELDSFISQTGFTWLGNFLSLYEYRIPVIVGTFAFCFVIIIIILIFQLLKILKENNKSVLTVENADNDKELEDVD